MKVTAGAVFGVVIPYIIYTLYEEAVHPHEHKPRKDMTYMHIRHKPFPWKEADCDLLDWECKKKWRDEHPDMYRK
jgi:hypothetical protein